MIQAPHPRIPCVLAASLLLVGAGCSRTGPSDATTPPPVPDSTRAAADAAPPPAAANAQNPSPEAAPVAMAREETRTDGQLQVSSPDIAAQGTIPDRFTDYGDGVSPALAWTPVEGARSYALLIEDPDAAQPKPFVHWVAWNIPGDVHELPGDLPRQGTLDAPDGMRQGRNGKAATGYFGPRPPVGDPPHHYHFEVLALDQPLDLPVDADREALVAAVASHVIAKGEFVATSAAPADAAQR